MYGDKSVFKRDGLASLSSEHDERLQQQPKSYIQAEAVVDILRSADGNFVIRSRKTNRECVVNKTASAEEIGSVVLSGFEMTKEEKFEALENLISLREPKSEHIDWIQKAVAVIVDKVQKDEI